MKKGKIIAALSAAAMLVVGLPQTGIHAEDSNKVYLTSDKGGIGDTVSVSVIIDSDIYQLSGMTFTLNYDSEALVLQGEPVMSSIFKNEFKYVNTDNEGSINVTYTGFDEGADFHDREIMKMSFTVLKVNSEITIDLEELNNFSLDAEDVSGVFTVQNITVECSHKNTETKTVIEDCKNGGSTVTACKDCGETVKTENIAPAEHTINQWTETKKATCAQKGEEEGVCTVCGKLFTRETDMVDHIYGEWEVTTPATCTEKGVETSTCPVCGKTQTKEINALGHDFGEWNAAKAATCTEKGTEERACSRCDKKETRETDVIDHTVEWAVTKEATCTEAGEKTGTCTVCGNKVTEEIPAAGHAFGEWITVKEATETEKGSEERECSVCGEKETKEIPVKIKPSEPIYDNNYNTDVTAAPESSENSKPSPDDNTVTTAPENNSDNVIAPESSEDNKPAPGDNTVTTAAEAINGSNTAATASENNTNVSDGDNNVNTGAGGIAAISGFAAIAAAAVVIAKKRK